jgi:hypothetical protein
MRCLRLWWFDSIRPHLGDEALVAEHLVCTEEEWVRLPPSPLGLRSVNGSTRPLYGRGAGSIPAGGFLASLTGVACAPRQETESLDARSSVESTALIRQARWFDSSRAHCGRSSDGRATGRHPEEARSIRVVRFQRSVV